MSKRKIASLIKGLLLSLLIVVVAPGCSDEELLEAVGIVRDTGSFSSGGCEWVIEINNEFFEPRILPAEFQVDGLTVDLKYKYEGTEVNCPVKQDFAGSIHINKIRKL